MMGLCLSLFFGGFHFGVICGIVLFIYKFDSELIAKQNTRKIFIYSRSLKYKLVVARFPFQLL